MQILQHLGVKVPVSIITQLVSFSSHTLTFPPEIQSHPVSLIYHMPLHIPFPLTRTECTPLANLSFLSFKVKLKVICYPCHIALPCFPLLVGCTSPALDLLWPTEQGGSDGGPVWGLGLKRARTCSPLPSPGELAQPNILEDQRHMEQSQVTAVTKSSQASPTDGQPFPRHAAQPTPSYPYMHQQSICY